MEKSQSIFKEDDGVQQYVVQWLCGVCFALLVGGLLAWWLVPIAYEQRGYRAVGGEWIIVLFAAFIAFQVGKWVFEQLKVFK